MWRKKTRVYNFSVLFCLNYSSLVLSTFKMPHQYLNHGDFGKQKSPLLDPQMDQTNIADVSEGLART